MPRKRTSILWTVSKEALGKIVKENNTLSGILKHFGFSHKGGQSKILKARLKEDAIEHSHIPLGWGFYRGGGTKPLPLEQVMVKNSTYNRGHLKNRIIKEGLLKEVCAICGREPEWEGKRLVLVIDHINGVHNDHRLENLQLLCPNCNSQTPTFAGRNLPWAGCAFINCSQCAKKITKKGNQSGLCRTCYHAERSADVEHPSRIAIRKVARPSKEELQKLIAENSWVGIGRMYGISDNAVRKWAKGYGLPTKKLKST